MLSCSTPSTELLKLLTICPPYNEDSDKIDTSAQTPQAVFLRRYYRLAHLPFQIHLLKVLANLRIIS